MPSRNPQGKAAIRADNSPLYVTKPSLPSTPEFMSYVAEILESGQFTNHGPLQARLEGDIARQLRLKHLTLCSNGTLALQLAIRLLGLNGKKVLTTPFSYVATVSALLWEGCTVVFADIDPNTLCLEEAEVTRALEQHPDIAGILPVHVFGNACPVAAFERLCAERGIACLYDAAHAFGARLAGRSLLEYGDASTGSFHATKLFHTVEGGCIVTHSGAMQKKAELMRAFGHVGDNHISLGINAKMSELHAAMGLCLLPRLEDDIHRRRQVTEQYDQALGLHANHRPGLRTPVLADGLDYNYAYYPVIFDDEATLLRVKDGLEAQNIFPRRYFYPSLTRLPYLPQKPAKCPVAEHLSTSILCLPFFADLAPEQVEQIAGIVLREL